MSVSYKAAEHTNKILDSIERSALAFTTTPELFRPEFWEFLMARAENPRYAQNVIEDVAVMAEEGITVVPSIAKNVAAVMHCARRTLRKKELSKVRKM
jgi:hypothetical protein